MLSIFSPFFVSTRCWINPSSLNPGNIGKYMVHTTSSELKTELIFNLDWIIFPQKLILSCFHVATDEQRKKKHFHYA